MAVWYRVWRCLPPINQPRPVRRHFCTGSPSFILWPHPAHFVHHSHPGHTGVLVVHYPSTFEFTYFVCPGQSGHTGVPAVHPSTFDPTRPLCTPQSIRTRYIHTMWHAFAILPYLENLHCFLVGGNKSYVIATADLWLFIYTSNLHPSLPTLLPYLLTTYYYYLSYLRKMVWL